MKFGVYEEDFGFWNKDEKITELEGNVKSDGTVITSQTWEASIQPGETGNQSEYYIKYIKYETTPGEYQVIKINDSPMLYVPHKTLVVGIAREETRKEYGIDFNLGADAISGTPTLKNVCDAKAKGTFCFKNKSHTVKIFMLPGPIAKSDPLVRISIVYPDRLHPKPDDWHFIFEPYNGNFEDCGEDTCTVWLPEWHPEGDGDELEPVMLDLRIESHDDGGFVPFLIRAEIVEPKPETPIVVMTPVYAIIAEGQNFILSEEFFEPPQIQPELFASETQQCIAGAILGEHSDIGSWLDFLSLFFIEQLGHEIYLEAIPESETIVSMLKNDEIDFALMSFSDFYDNRTSLNVTPLLLPSYEEVGSYYRGAFIVRADFGAQSFEDLEGSVFAYTVSSSYYGYHMPRAVLANTGYDLNAFFYDVISVGYSPHDMIMALLNGDADVGVIWAGEGTDARIMVENEIPDVWDATDILEYTPWIPNNVIVANENLPEVQLVNIQNAFIEASMDEGGQEALYGLYEIVALAEPDDRFWDAIDWLEYAEELDYEIGEWP